jgi:hypothetical protein
MSGYFTTALIPLTPAAELSFFVILKLPVSPCFLYKGSVADFDGKVSDKVDLHYLSVLIMENSLGVPFLCLFVWYPFAYDRDIHSALLSCKDRN